MFVVPATQVLELTNPTAPEVISFNLIFYVPKSIFEKKATISYTGLEHFPGACHWAKVVTYMTSPSIAFLGRRYYSSVLKETEA